MIGHSHRQLWPINSFIKVHDGGATPAVMHLQPPRSPRNLPRRKLPLTAQGYLITHRASLSRCRSPKCKKDVNSDHQSIWNKGPSTVNNTHLNLTLFRLNMNTKIKHIYCPFKQKQKPQFSSKDFNYKNSTWRKVIKVI
jgi:hypothetical protein